jgi:hypothetical protein
MKNVLTILSCVLGFLPLALGQGVSIQLALDQEQYLANETLIVKARISNFSGQTLHLGDDPDWLTFGVQDPRHLPVSRSGKVPVLGEFTLEPSMTATKKVDLSPYFDLSQPGRYSVSATLTVPGWRQVLQTKPVPFDIIAGSSVWEQEFGMPDSGRDGAGPELRRYALVQTLHQKTLKLYFRLTDSRTGRVIQIFPLGPVVTFSDPHPELDRFSNLHVLYQNGARLFIHSVINPDGVLLTRETYEITGSRPTLRPDKDGRITVVGGARYLSATDLPPPTVSTNASNAKPEQP